MSPNSAINVTASVDFNETKNGTNVSNTMGSHLAVAWSRLCSELLVSEDSSLALSRRPGRLDRSEASSLLLVSVVVGLLASIGKLQERCCLNAQNQMVIMITYLNEK